MRTAAAIIAAAAVLSGCAHSDEWTRRDTALQLAYTGVVIADAIQTADIQNYPDIQEAGWLAGKALGRNPDTSDTVLYFGTLAISHWMISRALPSKWRPYWQGVGIAVHLDAVISNCDMGLGWCTYEPSRDPSLDISGGNLQ